MVLIKKPELISGSEMWARSILDCNHGGESYFKVSDEAIAIKEEVD